MLAFLEHLKSKQILKNPDEQKWKIKVLQCSANCRSATRDDNKEDTVVMSGVLRSTFFVLHLPLKPVMTWTYLLSLTDFLENLRSQIVTWLKNLTNYLFESIAVSES